MNSLAHFFLPWETVKHPEDSFPLLHPALIATLATVVGDVTAAAHVLSGLMLFGYLVGLPAIALLWYGPVPALVLQAGLLSQEGWGYFDRPLNDPGAMVLAGFAFLALLRSLDTRSDRPLGSRWSEHLPFAMSVAMFAAATQYKHSANFAALAAAIALLVLDPSRPVRARCSRALVLLGGVALAHVPVLVWHWNTFGFPGLPHNARGRELARAIGHREDFWMAWQSFRTYMPAHPGAIPTLSEQVAQGGPFDPLVLAPLRRIALGMRHAIGQSEIAPIGWLGCLAVGARAPLGAQAKTAARLTLIAFAAFAVILPAFSHYEMRYLFPLRPLFAISAALAANELMSEVRHWRRFSMVQVVLVGALIAGALLPWQPSQTAARTAAVAAFAVAATGAWVLVRKGRPIASPALLGVVAFWLVSFGIRSASGLQRLLTASHPRENAVRDAAPMIRAATSPSDVIMARHVSPIAHYADRATVVVPSHTEDICTVATRYGARWLVLTPAERAIQQGLESFAAELPVHDQAFGFTLYALHCEYRP